MRRGEISSRQSQTRTKRVILAGEDDDALGRGRRLKHRNQILGCTRHPGSKFKVAIASVERTGRVKRVVSRAGINSRDAYPKCRDGKPAPKQYVRNTPVRKAARHQECFRRGPNSTVSADSFNKFSLEKMAPLPRTKKLYLMMA